MEERIPGPDGPAAGMTTYEQFLEALFPNSLFEEIVQHTNTQIENVCAESMAKGFQMQSYHKITDIVEIKALIGLIYYSGAWKSANVDVHHLWENENGICMYRAVMSRMRFSFLLICLRLDDKNSRDRNDRLALIRHVWSSFIENFRVCYKMSDKATVDEQLLSFRGRCIFRMYMKAKLDKYFFVIPMGLMGIFRYKKAGKNASGSSTWT